MGKNNYLVSHRGKTYFHETMVSLRRENIPRHLNLKNHNVRERTADVFKLWQRDTVDILAKTYDADFAVSKLPAVFKEAVIAEDMRELILPHLDFIKDTYLTLAINSGSYPFISVPDFLRFLRKMNVMDDELNSCRFDFILASVKAK